MNRIPFDPKELEAAGTIPPAFPGLPPVGTMVPEDQYRYVYELSRKKFN